MMEVGRTISLASGCPSIAPAPQSGSINRQAISSSVHEARDDLAFRIVGISRPPFPTNVTASDTRMESCSVFYFANSRFRLYFT